MEIIKKIYWIMSEQFGLDPRRMFRSLKGIPSYIADWIRFRRNYSGQLNFHPCLHDRYEEGGSTKDEYFWQDLHVAQKIHAAQPVKHVDIGSRIDGFVAHVASFREIEVFDIRPIVAEIPGVNFQQADLMAVEKLNPNYCDSLSCLHALEHFGLGRYGDPINPQGYEVGFSNMIRVLRAGGTFYLSVPVGQERVEFNANRVFDPRSIVGLAKTNGLKLRDFAWIGKIRKVNHSTNHMHDIEELSMQPYSLGIFTFVKQ